MAREKKTEEKVTTRAVKPLKKTYVAALGRQRSAIAQVRLYSDVKEVAWGDVVVKKGEMYVNKKPIEKYFSSEVDKKVYTGPFALTKTEGKFAVTITVVGGGNNGQLGAVVLGISRALVKHDPKHRLVLKKNGLLTRDARVRQRRKVGTGGKARRKKQSPKR